MELLQNAGKGTILMTEEELCNQMIKVEEAGRTCYRSHLRDLTPKTAERFIRSLLRRGHESVIEHTFMIVRFEGVSRGFTHEAVRHRHTGISQESTRYCGYGVDDVECPDPRLLSLHCVAPPHKDPEEPVLVEYENGTHEWLNIGDMFRNEEAYYKALRRAGWVPQDARQVLPIGICSDIVISTTMRQWRHMFILRTDKAAHWEIRAVMCALLEQVKQFVPVFFEDIVYDDTDSDGVPYYKVVPKKVAIPPKVEKRLTRWLNTIEGQLDMEWEEESGGLQAMRDLADALGIDWKPLGDE